MTIGFLQTARLNAVPLARHIDTPKKKKPQFRTQEEYAAAMLADAKQSKQTGTRPNYAAIDPAPMIDAIRKNPGITARGIADLLDMDVRQVSSKLCVLENSGTVRSVSVSTGKGRVRSFSIGNGQHHRGPTQSVQDVITFIADNPGCSTTDLAVWLDCTRKQASERIRVARKWSKIKTESGAGQRPARYWVETDEGEAAQ